MIRPFFHAKAKEKTPNQCDELDENSYDSLDEYTEPKSSDDMNTQLKTLDNPPIVKMASRNLKM